MSHLGNTVLINMIGGGGVGGAGGAQEAAHGGGAAAFRQVTSLSWRGVAGTEAVGACQRMEP